MGLGTRGKSKSAARGRRHARLRKKIEGTALRPRLVVTRSARHVFVQVVDDSKGETLAVVDDLHEYVASRTGDDATRPKRGPLDLLAKSCVPASAGSRLAFSSSSETHGYLPLFPALRRTISPA